MGKAFLAFCAIIALTMIALMVAPKKPEVPRSANEIKKEKVYEECVSKQTIRRATEEYKKPWQSIEVLSIDIASFKPSMK